MRHFFLLLSAACCVTALPRDEIGSGIDAAFKQRYQPVVNELVDMLQRQSQSIIPLMVRLAWHTMAQFNANEGRQGGSNGGCQRFNPERDDAANAGLDTLRSMLEPIFSRHSSFLTRADLYVLAGNSALEFAGAGAQVFRPGRVDFSEPEAQSKCPGQNLRSRMPDAHKNLDAFPHVDTFNYFHRKFSELAVEGSSEQEMIRLRVALMGGHTLGGMHRSISGSEGKWTSTPFQFNNEYFRALVDRDWAQASGVQPGRSNDALQYEERCNGCPSGKLVMLPIDVILKHDAKLFAAVKEFAANEALFNEYFARAWNIIASNGVHFLDAPSAPVSPPAGAPPRSGQVTGEGLKARAYTTGRWMRTFPDYNSLTPIAEWVSGTVRFNNKQEWRPFADVQDHFATRHFGYIQIDVAGDYTFYTTSDDGSLLFIDGKKVVDNGGTHGTETKEGTLRLNPGLHTIDLHFFEFTGGAVLLLEWRPPGSRKVLIPASVLRVAATDFLAGAGGPVSSQGPSAGLSPGLRTHVYRIGGRLHDFPDYNSLTPDATATSSQIRFMNKGMWRQFGFFVDNFASRHFGNLKIDVGGDYTFYTTSDDGSRLFIDGKKIVENGGVHGRKTEQGTVRLDVGLHTVDLQFFEHHGGAILVFEWSTPRSGRAVVTKENLFVSATDFGSPVGASAPPTGPVNLALDRPALSSATTASGAAGNAVDGNPDSRWISWTAGTDPAWLVVDLGAGTVVTGWAIKFSWFAVKVKVEVSDDCANNWTVIFEGTPALDDMKMLLSPVTTRCISIASWARTTIAVDEFAVI
ncbi:putative heme-binding peroxidase [Diplonema papillatum]|nr:putative heme-binding peroxidase [Diplonema papillatum]